VKKDKGFTLVESILALSVVGVVSAGVISTTAKKEQETHLNTFLNEAASIIFAVDHRLSIDGYTSENWKQFEWKNKDEVYNKLIKEELVCDCSPPSHFVSGEASVLNEKFGILVSLAATRLSSSFTLPQQAVTT